MGIAIGVPIFGIKQNEIAKYIGMTTIGRAKVGCELINPNICLNRDKYVIGCNIQTHCFLINAFNLSSL